MVICEPFDFLGLVWLPEAQPLQVDQAAAAEAQKLCALWDPNQADASLSPYFDVWCKYS